MMKASDGQIPRYRLLLECFRSGQMSERQMQAHMADDAGFRAFALESVAGDDAVRKDRRPEADRGL